jgi:hypothetical protein
MKQTLFQNVGTENSNAGKSPRRKNTLTTLRKFEITNSLFIFGSQVRDEVEWVDAG